MGEWVVGGWDLSALYIAECRTTHCQKWVDMNKVSDLTPRAYTFIWCAVNMFLGWWEQQKRNTLERLTEESEHTLLVIVWGHTIAGACSLLFLSGSYFPSVCFLFRLSSNSFLLPFFDPLVFATHYLSHLWDWVVSLSSQWMIIITLEMTHRKAFDISSWIPILLFLLTVLHK